MGKDLNRKVRRAARLSELFTSIYGRAIVRAVHNADAGMEAKVNAEFTQAITAFVSHGVQIGDAAANLKRNPFALFGLWSDILGDLFEEEREGVKAFCCRWSEYAGVGLSSEDADLIGAPNAG